MMRIFPQVYVDRFLSRIIRESNGCWLWTGPLTKSGVGQFRVGQEQWSSHRIAYAMFKGKLTDGKHLTHTCGVKHCVNPEHLEETNLFPVKATIEERFWAKVPERPDVGCWIWAGTSISGYPAIRMGRKNEPWLRAHRVSYEIHHGPVPEGLFICHKCDTPRCVRPDHLYAGTHVDNMRDMHERGRENITGLRPAKPGSAHFMAKLSETDVHEIRKLRAAGCGLKEIGKQYGIAPTHVHKIAHKKVWGHI